MTFNSVNQYTPTHKVWDHVGNVIPDVENSSGERPYLEGKPAAWLPVQFYDKNYEDWLVVMPGKILAADPQGRIVPAQYMVVAGAGPTALSTVTYTTNDVNNQTIDVRTGSPCTAASVSASPITLSAVTAWMGVTGLTWAASCPIGVAPYAYLQWAGDGSEGDTGNNPIYWRYHNYNRQHRVAVLCDYVLELPIVPAVASAQTLTASTRSGNVQTFTALGNLPVAMNTTLRTPITFASGTLTDSATRFVNQVSALTDIASAGDWFINLQTGVISCYSTTTLAGTYTITYYHYASAATTVSRFACVLAPVIPGDLLKCDANSNWVVATPKVFGFATGNNFDTFAHVMGQVLEIQSQPQDYLDRVRTGFTNLSTSATGALPGTAGQMDQMPGSATGGVSDKVHYAGAANLVALVNMVSR